MPPLINMSAKDAAIDDYVWDCMNLFHYLFFMPKFKIPYILPPPLSLGFCSAWVEACTENIQHERSSAELHSEMQSSNRNNSLACCILFPFYDRVVGMPLEGNTQQHCRCTHILSGPLSLPIQSRFGMWAQKDKYMEYCAVVDSGSLFSDLTGIVKLDLLIALFSFCIEH